MQVTADQVKELREATGAGVMDCKRALESCGGDLDKAKEWLRRKGLDRASEKAGRVVAQGLVHAYIHHNHQLGVLVELNSESDFVARNEEFRHLAHEIAVHIAAANPKYLRREEVPAAVAERQVSLYREQGRDFYKERVLLEQPWAKDEKKSVGDLLKEAIAKMGENITISRFARFSVGEATSQQTE